MLTGMAYFNQNVGNWPGGQSFMTVTGEALGFHSHTIPGYLVRSPLMLLAM